MFYYLWAQVLVDTRTIPRIRGFGLVRKGIFWLRKSCFCFFRRHPAYAFDVPRERKRLKVNIFHRIGTLRKRSCRIRISVRKWHMSMDGPVPPPMRARVIISQFIRITPVWKWFNVVVSGSTRDDFRWVDNLRTPSSNCKLSYLIKRRILDSNTKNLSFSIHIWLTHCNSFKKYAQSLLY